MRNKHNIAQLWSLVWDTLSSGLQTGNNPNLWHRQSSTSWTHSNFENILTDFPEEMYKSLFWSFPTQNKHPTLNEGKHNLWLRSFLMRSFNEIIFKSSPPKHWTLPICTKHISFILFLHSRIKCGVMTSCILWEKSPVPIPKLPNFLRKTLKIANFSLKILYHCCTNKSNRTCHTTFSDTYLKRNDVPLNQLFNINTHVCAVYCT